MKALLAAVGIFSAAMTGPASAVDTESLYKLCKSPEPVSQATCTAYLLGVASVMAMLGKEYTDAKPGEDKDFRAPFAAIGLCATSASSGPALRQIFINWAEKHVAEWKASVGGSAMTAFQEAWPCK
jgi:hypothetical protein